MKDIPGFEEKYAITTDGKVYSKISNRLLNPIKRSGWYIQTGIFYDSSTEAAKAKGISKEKLLNNMRTNKYKRREPMKYGLSFV